MTKLKKAPISKKYQVDRPDFSTYGMWNDVPDEILNEITEGLTGHIRKLVEKTIQVAFENEQIYICWSPTDEMPLRFEMWLPFCADQDEAYVFEFDFEDEVAWAMGAGAPEGETIRNALCDVFQSLREREAARILRRMSHLKKQKKSTQAEKNELTAFIEKYGDQMETDSERQKFLEGKL